MGSFSTKGLATKINPTPSTSASYREYMNYINGLQNSDPTYNPDGSVNFNGAITNNTLNMDKAYTMVNAQLKIEQDYLAAQNSINDLLNFTQNMFATSTCNTAAITSEMRSETISTIIGTTTTNKALVWDKTDVSAASAVANSNIILLTAAGQQFVQMLASGVGSSDPAAVGLINSLVAMDTFHTKDQIVDFTPGGTTFGQIQVWIVGEINKYNNTCTLVGKTNLSEWGIQSSN